MNGSAPIYTISAVARTLGVPVATLRTWEDRYELVIPERTPGRHRLYTRSQVGQLEFVKAQMDRGASAAEAHRMLRDRDHNQTSPSPGANGAASDELILLAENDPYAADLERHYLQAAGYQVELALDVEAAAGTIDQRRPSLVVLELLISGGLGLELCRSIKQRWHPPPVLAVSTLDSRKRALEAGAAAFLTKPLDPSRFTSTVAQLLGSGVSLADRSPAAM